MFKERDRIMHPIYGYGEMTSIKRKMIIMISRLLMRFILIMGYTKFVLLLYPSKTLSWLIEVYKINSRATDGAGMERSPSYAEARNDLAIAESGRF
ncbi:MAG: hypothetical protein LBG43_02750 [Treponema sp.]|jgi:hypothetical protein|nr:hypothetical protein [Treponema sp.]